MMSPADGSSTSDRSDDPERRSRERAERARAATSCDASCERVSLAVPRDTHFLHLVRKVVADLAGRAGFTGADLDKVELAVDEACSNAIIYQVATDGPAALEVELRIERRGPHVPRPRFVIVLRDRGAPYPFEEHGNFDLEDHLRRLEPGGLGIYIIKNFMDEVVYEHCSREGNRLTMIKFLPTTR